MKSKKMANEIVNAINKVNENKDWFEVTASVTDDIGDYEVSTNADFCEIEYEILRKIADYFELIYGTTIHISVYGNEVYLY